MRRLRAGAATRPGAADTDSADKDAPDPEASPLLKRLGPAVPSANKLIRDRNGQRWRVHPGLMQGAPQRLRAVRTTGPAPQIDWSRAAMDPLSATEQLYAHRQSLHTAFSTAWRCRISQSSWTRPVPRESRASEAAIATRGSSYPSFISVGRWRQREIHRRDSDSAVTVPWIVADIDGPGRYASDQHARTLCTLLRERGVGLSEVVVSYTGGKGFHVRIPHGLFGCPVYQNAKAAQHLLRRFFDRLCDGHPALREAIDDAVCRPQQAIRMIGSTREDGQCCVATTADNFIRQHPLVLFGHSDAGRYSGFTLPKPENTSYATSVGSLLLDRRHIRTVHPIHERVRRQLQEETSKPKGVLAEPSPPKPAIHVNIYCWKPIRPRPPPTLQNPGGRVIARLLGPVIESQAWGTDVDQPYAGRNWAAFIMGLYVTSYPELASQRIWAALRSRYGTAMPKATVPEAAVPASDALSAEAVLRAWNQAVCRPPLPEAELMTTLTSARRYTDGPGRHRR